MPAPNANPAPRHTSERRAAGHQRIVRILLVEDDPDIRHMLTFVLQREGYEVTAAATADQALAHMRRQRHDVVVTDYCLPQKDGLSFLAEAQATGVLAKAPVIVCTAFPPAGQTDLAVLEKPIDLDALMERIRNVLGR